MITAWGRDEVVVDPLNTISPQPTQEILTPNIISASSILKASWVEKTTREVSNGWTEQPGTVMRPQCTCLANATGTGRVYQKTRKRGFSL